MYYFQLLIMAVQWDSMGKLMENSVKRANVLIQTPWQLMHMGDKICRERDSHTGR
jgi:hypothetical protein